jgi:hypothetical protein
MKRRRPQPVSKPKASRQRPEQTLQLAVMRQVEMRLAPGAIVWHTPNAAKRGLVEGNVFRRCGTRAGIPDLLALRPGGPLCGLELKAPKGRLSPAQRETIAALKTAGACVEVCNNLDDALRCLEQWKILRGVTQCVTQPLFSAIACRASRISRLRASNLRSGSRLRNSASDHGA